MHLVSLQYGSKPSAGVLLDDHVVNLQACAPLLPAARCIPASVRGILEGGDAALDLVRRVRGEIGDAGSSLRDQFIAQGALCPLATTRLLAPLPDPRLVLASGMNYWKHLHEMGGAAPSRPLAFTKSSQAIIGPNAPIVLPRLHGNMVDWEAEFCVVIGRPCHDVPIDAALDHVAGYTMVNDVSARDWVVRFDELKGMAAIDAWEQNILGKHFPTFCPMGPTLATKDELPNPDAVRFELSVNGQVMQSACTDDLVFGIAALVSHYSQYYAFQPGDIITTGSPAGVGFGQKPQRFLRAGDKVTIRADGIGVMTNPVIGSDDEQRLTDQ